MFSWNAPLDYQISIISWTTLTNVLKVKSLSCDSLLKWKFITNGNILCSCYNKSKDNELRNI